MYGHAVGFQRLWTGENFQFCFWRELILKFYTRFLFIAFVFLFFSPSDFAPKHIWKGRHIETLSFPHLPLPGILYFQPVLLSIDSGIYCLFTLCISSLRHLYFVCTCTLYVHVCTCTCVLCKSVVNQYLSRYVRNGFIFKMLQILQTTQDRT